MSETPCEWLDGLLNGDYDFTVYSRKNARAELAQLRSDLQAAQERIAQLEAAIAFSDAEQARQRDAVREILSVFCNQDHTGKELYTAYDRADDWLAANPVPQVEQP